MPKTGNSATALEPAGPPAAAAEQLTLIDVDCHHISRPDSLDPYLDERWAAYRRTYGIRTRMDADLGITLRPFAARNDAFPPNGTPGSDPDFTRAQLLDEYGIDIAILNNIQGQIEHVGGNQPARSARPCSRPTTTGRGWSGSPPIRAGARPSACRSRSRIRPPRRSAGAAI